MQAGTELYSHGSYDVTLQYSNMYLRDFMLTYRACTLARIKMGRAWGAGHGKQQKQSTAQQKHSTAARGGPLPGAMHA